MKREQLSKMITTFLLSSVIILNPISIFATESQPNPMGGIVERELTPDEIISDEWKDGTHKERFGNYFGKTEMEIDLNDNNKWNNELGRVIQKQYVDKDGRKILHAGYSSHQKYVGSSKRNIQLTSIIWGLTDNEKAEYNAFKEKLNNYRSKYKTYDDFMNNGLSSDNSRAYISVILTRDADIVSFGLFNREFKVAKYYFERELKKAQNVNTENICNCK